MDRLPLEILQQIFKLACTDGGYTGCSLALTSKPIREAAQSTRFHSIALAAKLQRLVALVTLYQSQCSNVAGIRPRTSSLYLSFQRHLNTSQTEEPTEEDEWDESEDEEPTSPTGSSLVPARFAAAQTLFSLVADDLQSLVIAKNRVTADHPLFDRPFPSLRDLTLVRHPDPAYLIRGASDILPLFPALTHLHLVAPEWSHPLLAGWIAHAPHVTHLRISAPSHVHQLLDELPDAVGAPAHPARHGVVSTTATMTVGPPPAVRTYPTLARIIVERGTLPVAGACGTSRKAFISRGMRLWSLAQDALRAGVEMRVPSPRAWTGREWDEAIRREWLKRLGGERGRDWFGDAEEESESEGESEDGDADEDGKDRKRLEMGHWQTLIDLTPPNPGRPP